MSVASESYKDSYAGTTTDWYATRMAETGKAIPEEIIEKRQAARDRVSALRG